MTSEELSNEEFEEIEVKTEPVRVEEFTVSGSDVVDKLKSLLHQGNIRRIIVKTDAGKTLVEIPLTFGLAGVALITTLAPMLTVIGAVATMVARWRIVVERLETS